MKTKKKIAQISEANKLISSMKRQKVLSIQKYGNIDTAVLIEIELTHLENKETLLLGNYRHRNQ